MEITRNQFFMAGLVLLLLGIQFRMIESVELKEQFAKFIAERSDHPLISVSAQTPVLSTIEGKRAWIGSSIRRNGLAGCFSLSAAFSCCTAWPCPKADSSFAKEAGRAGVPPSRQVRTIGGYFAAQRRASGGTIDLTRRRQFVTIGSSCLF